MSKRRAAARTILSCLLLLAAAPLRPQELSPRTVTVRLVVDRAIGDLLTWRYEANRFIEEGLRVFRKRFGLVLTVEDPVRWKPEDRKASMEEALVDLRTKVQPGGCDIVVGIVAPDRIKTPALGIASYPHGYILLCNVGSVKAMSYAFQHELCHIFGAIDLKEKGSVMGIVDPGFAFDDFTTRVVLLNKARSFDRISFPLAKDALDAAVLQYRGRAELGLGEPQAKLFLTLLYMEKNDLESAARACGEAADAVPGYVGIHVLLGNICLRQNETDLAVGEFKKALKVQPAEFGIRYNLGLAYIQKHMYTDAVDEFRAAIGINPNYVRAHIALARLRLAAGDSLAAATECRAALKSEPQSAEALCVLGTALVAIDHPFLPLPEMREAKNRDPGMAPAAGSPNAGEAIAEAIPLLQRSIALNPDDPEAHNSLGSAYAIQRKYPEAEAEFLRALAIKPNNLDAHFNLGSLYSDTGNLAKAAFHLERIMAIDPQSDLGRQIIVRAYQVQKTYILAAQKPDK
jgi:tetratricopeptide (TPR) repeat protein